MSRVIIVFIVVMIFSVLNKVQAEVPLAYKAGEIAVKFDKKTLLEMDPSLLSSGRTGLDQFDAVCALHDVTLVERHFPQLNDENESFNQQDLAAWFKVYFSQNVDVQAIATQFAAVAGIVRAEAIPIHAVDKTANDPNVSQQWHITQSNDADIDAPEGWDIQTGNPAVIVALMDTGVEWFHKDLGGSNASSSDRNSILGNIWINAAELANSDPDVDDDGNGYNDDWIGWDFVNTTPLFNLGDDYSTPDNDPRDKNGHGTHGAGNVAAINNNNRGVCSAAGGWGEDVAGNGNGVKIMVLRIGWDDFPSGRVSMDFAAQAFVYARANGARIASCSWGSSEYGPLVDALNNFIFDKTSPVPGDPKVRLVFKSAGNDGTETADYMNSRGDIVSVSATTATDAAASFTNYGSWVDIAAPGDNIYSTAVNGGYVSYSGTSMSSPIAASVTALIWSHSTSLTAVDVENYLYQGADNIESKLATKYKTKMGHGRVSASGSLALVPVNHRPVATNDTAATSEDTAVTVFVLTNDSDSDGDALTISSVTAAQHGVLTTDGQSVNFTPAENFFGADSFHYVVSDAHGGLDTALVVLTVASRNDAPQIINLPQDLSLVTNSCVYLEMNSYAQDVDTPYPQLSWSFAVSDPAISYSFNAATDSLEICANDLAGDFSIFVTLTDDSSAADHDTIAIHVDIPSAMGDLPEQAPATYVLQQNYPNPFNPTTTIRFGLPEAGDVRIEIYNIVGQKLLTLREGFTVGGYHEITFDASTFGSGVYFCKMTANNFQSIRKMILIK